MVPGGSHCSGGDQVLCSLGSGESPGEKLAQHVPIMIPALYHCVQAEGKGFDEVVRMYRHLETKGLVDVTLCSSILCDVRKLLE